MKHEVSYAVNFLVSTANLIFWTSVIVGIIYGLALINGIGFESGWGLTEDQLGKLSGLHVIVICNALPVPPSWEGKQALLITGVPADVPTERDQLARVLAENALNKSGRYGILEDLAVPHPDYFFGSEADTCLPVNRAGSVCRKELAIEDIKLRPEVIGSIDGCLNILRVELGGQ